jgi:(4-alkanoyl-5-oxo-2,5-dihydrofuran-3-yl)methyl phosphate reductase
VITMILVTGASGTVGRGLVDELSSNGLRLRALTRDPGATRFPAGVEPVQGDLGDQASLGAAVAGVELVFLTGAGPLRPVHDRNLAAAAAAAGVAHIVQLSSLAVEERSDGVPPHARVLAGWHAAGERAVRDGSVPWTILRPNGFMSNALGWAGSISAGDVIRAPFGDLPSSAVDPGDVAAAAAAVLRDPGGHAGAVYRLTGPAALSPQQQVLILGEVLGRKLRFEQQPVQEARQELAGGMDPLAADAVLAAREHADLEVRTSVHQGVRDLTGRQPRSFRQWAVAHADAFGGQPPDQA